MSLDNGQPSEVEKTKLQSLIGDGGDIDLLCDQLSAGDYAQRTMKKKWLKLQDKVRKLSRAIEELSE